MDPIARPVSLTEMTTDRLRLAIVNGEFAFGEALSEGRLAQLLGVSKTPVREALANLRQEGMIDVQPQRGSFVFTPDEDALRSLIDYRTVIELGALDLALSVAPGPLAASLMAIAREMDHHAAADERVQYLERDGAFHEAIFDHCGNDYLQNAHARMAGQLGALRMKFGGEPEQMAKSLAEHKAIAKSVAEVAEGRTPNPTPRALLEDHIARKQGSYWNDLKALT